ncbi:DNA polymerase theta-like isoform X1 [Oculina patagonica]
MRRLSQTWKQKRPSDRNQHALKQRVTKVRELKNDKDNQSNNKPDQCIANAPSPSASFNFSFGFEFDAAALSEVDKMDEQHLLCDNVPQSPLTSSNGALKENVTPKLAAQAFITPSSSTRRSESVVNKFGRARERISTPIEDSEHMALFSSTHSPMFSPVTGAFQQFENSTDRSQARRRSFENAPGHENKSHLSSRLSDSHSRSVLEPDVSSSGNPLELSSWGLPAEVLRRYNELGITHMFEWQADCLRTGKVLTGGNLVYSAPTSAGKTMVAELLMLKRVLETKRKALFILPFISVAREKMFYLQRLYQEAGVRVEGYMGSHAPPGGFVSVDIAVCTIEKANSLLNRLLEENKVLSSLGIVVVDEMHMIGDSHRGYLLELFLTKIRYIAGCNGQNVGNGNEAANEETSPAIQIVGMSATLPNLDMLAKWLSADLYFTDHRPVPLTEMVKVGSTLYDANMERIREISGGTVSGDEDHVIPLCKETIVDGHSVLVFCPTKNWCEKLAETIAKHFAEIGSLALQDGNSNSARGAGFVKASELITFDYAALKEVIEQLKRTQVGLDSVLSRMVPHGVAFHHAGLTFDERDIIEGAFRQGSIRVLVATSTLSSGVNLPARRVIIRTPMFHGKLVDALIYKQMAGRAGRKGVDALGESVLICKPAERQKAASLLNSRLKAVESCLLGKEENGGIKRALLEVIASGVVIRPQDVERYAACTFFASVPAQQDANDTDAVIKKTVKFLVENEFVRLQKCDDKKTNENKENNGEAEEVQADEQRYVPTQLGVATLSSALSPDEALVVFAEVQKARKCFVLESELHIIYQVTPIYIQDQWPNIDWYQYLRIYERLPANMRRVADMVGVEEGFLARAVRGRVLTRTEQQRQSLAVHRRFYAALALQDLVHEVPLNIVARRYGANRGMLQSLQGSSATFAGMVTVFCEKLGWTNIELLLSQFQSRLSFGVERDLCDLVRISLLNAARARMLYNAGYHTIASVAAAPPSEIENILHNAAPFVSGRKRGQETETEVRERSEARVIWVAGRRGLTEGAAAKLIVAEAKQLLQADVAQLGIQWKPPESDENTGGQGSQGNSTTSGATEGSSKSVGMQPAEALQSAVGSKTVGRTEAVIGKHVTKSNADASSDKHKVHTNGKVKESGTARHSNHRQEIAGPSLLGNKVSIDTGADFLKPSSQHVDTRVLTYREKGQTEVQKAASITSVLKDNACPSTSKPAQVSDCKQSRPPSNTVNPVTPLGSGTTRSRNKRRSPIPEMPEPQEKLQKKETAAVNMPEVNIQKAIVSKVVLPEVQEGSSNSTAVMEVSTDSKVGNEAQSVSVELYSEPFEGEEPAAKEKPDDAAHEENNDLLDSQALAAYSLSDTCLMECDVIIEEKVDKSTAHACAVNATNEPPGKEREALCDKVNIATAVTPRSLAALESQDIIGEYDTQPRFPGTGEFHVEQSLEILSSSASPVLQSPKCSITDDLASVSAPNSFSLRLSSSDGCLDSDLSMLAVVELIEKEVDANKKSLPGVPHSESDFTKIKNPKSTNSPKTKDERSPAKKMSRSAVTHDDEIDGIEMPDSDIVPSTPPRDKRPSQDDFRTKLSATPLSTRKRASPRRSPYSNTPDEGLVIIDVAGHEQVFAMFLKEWRSQTRFSLAVACERFLDDVPRIGGRFSNAPASKGTLRGLKVEGEDLVVVGVAVSWGGKDAYFVSLKEHAQSAPSQPDDSQAESAVDSNLTLARRVNALKSVVQSLTERGRLMVCFDVKEHFKTFARCTGISLGGPAEDPKVASWLLDPGAKEKNLHQLVGQHLPEEAPLLEGSGGGLGTGGLALAYQCQQSGRVRACVESVLVLSLMKKLRPLLEAEDLMSAFTKVEMPSALCLARMELNGLGFSDTESEHLKNILQAKLRTLEQEAYRLANHSFSLTSREDVAQVLFVELKLPHDGNSEDGQAAKRKTLGVTRRGTSRGTKNLSTNKDVLERLKPLHPLPGLIIEWRRINSALTKVVFPLQKEKCLNARLNMPRIHSMSQTHTATGRVSFAEPNLQNVPKDFDIILPTTIAESPPRGVWDERCSSKRGRRRASRQNTLNVGPGANSTGVAPNFAVSMRNAFVPFKNGVLLAADYSQLELRLIAHLANDERLRKILNGGGDVFRMIAGELYRAPAESIKDNQRQHAKQVCYGIIYGIGAKALGEQLGLAEEEASLFIDKFTSRFVGVRKYLKETVEQCKKQGYVKTVTRRKRFLPAINSPNVHAHSQAARQAVNTTVQGSAADLVKTAMVNIDKRLTETFPSCVMTHRHSSPDLQATKSKTRGRRSKCDVSPLIGGYFVLQLHDELIFEVAVSDLRSVAQIVKTEMENAMKLSVVLPVKMKAGPSWGNMAEFEL